MFSIRLATLADAVAVTKVLEASYGQLLAADYDPDVLRHALPFMTRAQPALLQSGSYYVADDGGVIGCGGWTRERPGSGEIEPGLVHFRHFATHPSHVRRGVARALAEHSLAAAVAAGATRCCCYATISAEPFYRSLGFARDEAMTIPMGDVVFPGVLMSRAC